MTRSFVLMTAMPPTKGHLHLIEFAESLRPNVTVLLCTQDGEPFVYERYAAIANATAHMRGVKIVRLHRDLPQDPETPGFWKLWLDIMREHGCTPSDLIVTSEPYGARLAEMTGSTFFVYDPDRRLYFTKATNVRESYNTYFADILPEFQKYLRKTVTVFGAESTGKTTLSEALSRRANGHWLFEWARPYLETVGPEITVKAMHDIWHGQSAIQRHVKDWVDKPWVIQDTDLYSTIGYWEQPHWTELLGPVPEGLVQEAAALKSDLYIMPRSNIPFERDTIRYGIDKRESPDDFWLGIADKYDLPLVVLDSDDHDVRLKECEVALANLAETVHDQIFFDRQGY